MTILIIAAVVLLSVRIAVVLWVCVLQHRENGDRLDLEDPKAKVNRQVMSLRVPAQTHITKDNVSVRVDAVVYFRVVDEVQAPPNGQDLNGAISQLAQTSLRSVIGSAVRDDLFPNREEPGRGVTEIMAAPRRGPQDAPGPQDATLADLTIAHVEESADLLAAPSQGKPVLADVKADLVSAIAVAKGRGTTKAVRDLAAGRRLPFVKLGRDDSSASGEPMRKRPATPDRTILDSVPRPVGGPSYLGGREDAAYLRGWDDAVDWIGQGNQPDAPAWGGVAYMTGWNDAVKAIARARRSAETSPTPPTACSTQPSESRTELWSDADANRRAG